MKSDREVEVWLHLTSTGEGGEWSASLYSRFIHGRRAAAVTECYMYHSRWIVWPKCGPQGVLMRAAMNPQVPNLEFLCLLNSCYLLKKASALWSLFVTIFNEYDSEGVLYCKW